MRCWKRIFQFYKSI